MYGTGGSREVQPRAGLLEASDLVVSLRETSAGDFYKWHEDFLIKGHSSASDERSGTLEFLGHDMRTVLATARFHGLGIYKLTPDKAEAQSEKLRRVTAAMYCQEIDFTFGGAATAATAAAPPPPSRAAVSEERERERVDAEASTRREEAKLAPSFARLAARPQLR